MANPVAISLHVLAASIASGAGEAVDLLEDSEGEGPLRKALKLALDLRAVSGSGAAILVEVETSPDSATWTRLHAFQALGAAELLELVIGPAQRYVRAKWTVTGSTPSLTWSLTGEAHVVYCEPRDITGHAVPASSIEDISEPDRWEACLTASDEADGYIGGAYALPLLAWGLDLRGKVAVLVAAHIFAKRGYDPNGPDKNVIEAADKARTQWFNRLADGKLSPPGIVDSTGDEVYEGGSVVVSSGTSRGW